MNEHQEYLKIMKNAAANWFSEKKMPARKDRNYVLPKHTDWIRNIILPEVSTYCQENISPSDIHTHANSGISSQIMLFNLVGPLIIANDLEPLKTAFIKADIGWPEKDARAEFEFSDPSILGETRQYPTSVDLLIRDGDDQPFLLIEAKLTERNFGGCSSFSNKKCEGLNPINDLSLCYLHNKGRLYWKLMLEFEYHQGQIKELKDCVLIEHYQFFRNALLASNFGRPFVVLHDARSPIFEKEGKGLVFEIKNLIPEKHHHLLKSISIQQIITEIKSSGRHDWIIKFEKKYGLV